MKFLQLILTMAELKRQVYQKNVEFLQLQLYHQTLYPFTEVMKCMRFDLLIGQKGISLFVHQRNLLHHGIAGIF